MSWLFASGHAADLMLALLVVQGAALVWLWRARRRGVPPGQLLAFLGAGALLALALRAALTGAHWGWVALWVALSLPAQLAWVVLSWRTAPGAGTSGRPRA
jgi:hypothetical protein